MAETSMQLVPQSVFRKCRKCTEDKAISEFGKDFAKADGLMRVCRSCNNATRRKYYTNNREKVREKRKAKYAALVGRDVLPHVNVSLRDCGVKRCHRCNEIKKHGEFRKVPTNCDGVGWSCRDCEKTYQAMRSEVRKLEGRCTRCGLPRPCAKCTQRVRSMCQKLQAEAVAAYGGHCQHPGCAVTTKLQWHHILGDGDKHRKEDQLHTPSCLIRWMRERNYQTRDYIALLCFPHHTAADVELRRLARYPMQQAA